MNVQRPAWLKYEKGIVCWSVKRLFMYAWDDATLATDLTYEEAVRVMLVAKRLQPQYEYVVFPVRKSKL